MGLKLENVTYTYETGTAMQVTALEGVSAEIPDDRFIGLIGHTGSGKSTLVQMLNGLLKPSSGHIYYNGEDIHGEGFDKKKLRSKVGLVFQYPEHQLFEETVLADVMFGPRNLGLTEEECRKRAVEALRHVGMEERFFEQSPFDLSGGQKRRAALAGVIAMEPKVLILDEPAAGLDPGGRAEVLGGLKKYQRTVGSSIIIVSHSMEDMANYCDRIVVMTDGKIVMTGTPSQIFARYNDLIGLGLDVPRVTRVAAALSRRGIDLGEVYTVGYAVEKLSELL